ncbi:MAG: hypothetical protein QXP86_04585 [Nitrososphaerota archaeon]
MPKRAIVIFTNKDIENLVGELSRLIIARGGRVLYRKVSARPVFVFFGGEVGNAERV